MNAKEFKKWTQYGFQEIDPEKLPHLWDNGAKIVIRGDDDMLTVPSNFLSDHNVIMYTTEEGGIFHYHIVESEKVDGIMKGWMNDGKLVLPIAGSPKAFNMVDTVKAFSVTVLGAESEFTKVPMKEWFPDANKED
jgi:hypothetical protein